MYNTTENTCPRTISTGKEKKIWGVPHIEDIFQEFYMRQKCDKTTILGFMGKSFVDFLQNSGSKLFV